VRPGVSVDRRDFLRYAAAGVIAVPLEKRGSVDHVPSRDDPQAEATAFLARYVEAWLPRETALNEAQWLAQIDVSESHTQAQVSRTLELNKVVGSLDVIETVQSLLARKDRLDGVTIRQLEKIRLKAAEAPGTVPDAVTARAEAEAHQSATQDGFV